MNDVIESFFWEARARYLSCGGRSRFTWKTSELVRRRRKVKIRGVALSMFIVELIWPYMNRPEFNLKQSVRTSPP